MLACACEDGGYKGLVQSLPLALAGLLQFSTLSLAQLVLNLVLRVGRAVQPHWQGTIDTEIAALAYRELPSRSDSGALASRASRPSGQSKTYIEIQSDRCTALEIGKLDVQQYN